MVVKDSGGDFELEEREVPEPGLGEALVPVHACGICDSDSSAKIGGYPGMSNPLVPGHEMAALGEHVQGWEVGRRVGVGWFGGNCFSVLQEVKPMIETLPLERAGEAYEKMMSGDARFRMVLTTGA
jgi:D-arabinose 1-dehydrogenase-like Zn-dependent alcohol dehydrogenase